MDQVDWWNELGRFWERSTGGADVAARPIHQGDNAQWPTAPRPAGVEQACAWLKGGFSGVGIPRFLFLVGGPGAGKSHAAAEVVRDLERIGAESALAQRSYEYHAGFRNLRLINDATIGSDEYPVAPLSMEIDAAITSGDHFLACVNRGVVVEELAQLRRSGRFASDHSGGNLVKWIHSAKDQQAAFSTQDRWTIEYTVDRSYIRAGRYYNELDEVAEVMVIYLDVNSLFEFAPDVTIGQLEVTADLSAEDYRVLPFESRRDQPSSFCPAGALVTTVVSQIKTPSEGYAFNCIDPFLANVESMQNEAVRRGVLSVLRAAEIVSGQRMTFREIWGALSRCLIGGAHTQYKSDGLQGLVDGLQPIESDNPRERFAKLRRLAEFRYSQAIFGSTSESSEVDRDPVLRLVYQVDPVRDAIPGRFANLSDSGWSSSIADAFSSDSGNSSPLGGVLASLDSSDDLVGAISNFDRELDKAYVAALVSREAPLNEVERREATTWYGAYLTRLFALVNGIPAFRREVTAWTVAWDMAPNIPHLLEDQLTTLLKPLRYPEKGSGVPLFPVYESRTNPIQGDVTPSRIAIRSKDVQVSSSVEADSLFVSVNEAGREEVAMLLDFSMIREAMACAAGFSGATELSDATSPRLERFRAARLVPGRKMDTSNYRIVLGSEDKPLTVETPK